MPVRAAISGAGPYGWLTRYIASIAANNTDFARRVLFIPRDELHFIALCLSLMGSKRDDPDHVAAFARGIGIRARKAIFAEFAPDADAKIVGLAGKLAGKPWRASSYARLAMLYSEPHARKTLNHLPHITRWQLIALARLPAPYRRIGILRKIKQRYDLSCVQFGIEIVRRVRTDLNDRQIIASLEKADTSRMRDWVEAHYERLPFPQAPTGALTDGQGAVLRPVSTADELMHAARVFDNCIGNYLWEVQSGRSYFYRCDIGERRVAIAELSPLPGVGWAVADILGPKNRALNGADRAHIFALFRAADILPSPQASSRFSWFDLN